MHVYAIQRPDGQVKIGTSTAPTARIRSIETQGGFASVNVFVSEPLEDARAVERASHELLSDRRAIGEWFDVLFDEAVAAVRESARSTEKEAALTGVQGAFVKAVRRVISASGVNQKKIAEQTGIDPGNLNRIVNGKQWPTPDRIDALAEFFGVMPWFLFYPPDAPTEADAILSTLTPEQRTQALRMLKAFAESCRAPE